MKLWIDDLRNPAYYGHADWYWAKSNTEAIRILQSSPEPVDEIAIDHDICHTLPGDPSTLRPICCTETFEATARFLSIMHRDCRCTPIPITIHTSNPAGAEKIKNILTLPCFKVTVIPGGI